MVERALRMREVKGSMPFFSICFFFFSQNKRRHKYRASIHVTFRYMLLESFYLSVGAR